MDKDFRGKPSPEAEIVDAPHQRTQRDRRCPLCGIRLSQYNPGPNCWQHTIGHPWRGPTAKPKY